VEKNNKCSICIIKETNDLRQKNSKKDTYFKTEGNDRAKILTLGDQDLKECLPNKI